MAEPLPDADVGALNDRFAREHPIDDYYAHAFLPIRFIERRRLAIIRQIIGEAAGLELCEVGSGGGHVLRMFPRARLTAVDVSEVFLETARRNLAGYDVRFLRGELDQVGLPAASFDRFICTEVLEHAFDPERILAAMARLLKPGGVAAITVPNEPLIIRLKAMIRRTPVGWLMRDRIEWGGDVYHLHRWTPDECQRLLERHFRVTARRGAPFDAFPIRACFRCERR
ncbi:MAG TPA: methyltransferase domain-containing protein [Candidatus Binatia bacterium]|nr:methyltransferase domain-containing protein [Candidatus Binatia bacterium]